jgi:prolyl-tRNA editing enzyme YbaK/EbsC (Cys-tRNA(Pro) deacylase)
MTSATISKFQELLSRVEALERKRYANAWIDSKGMNDDDDDNNNNKATSTSETAASSTVPCNIIIDESMRRARYAVERQTTFHYSAVWKFVPENYYHRSLEERARSLHAPSIHYLCKSLLLENRKVATTAPSDPTNPRFMLVVLQYASVLDTKLLINTIRKLRTDVTQRLDVSQFDIRIATEADNDRLTGYAHNSVTPFGMRCHQPQQDQPPVPIILSSALLPLHFLWLGGGHIHLKLGMSIADFCHAFRNDSNENSNNLIIADISRPRTSTGTDMNDDDQIDL